MLPDKNWRLTHEEETYESHTDIVRRIQQGDSERRIAKDMQISRGTVHKYFKIAKEKGYLEKTDTQPSGE